MSVWVECGFNQVVDLTKAIGFETYCPATGNPDNVVSIVATFPAEDRYGKAYSAYLWSGHYPEATEKMAEFLAAVRSDAAVSSV